MFWRGQVDLDIFRFDILPITNQHEWVPTSHGLIPQGRRPVDGGYEESGDRLYHAVAVVHGCSVPGKTGEHLGIFSRIDLLCSIHAHPIHVCRFCQCSIRKRRGRCTRRIFDSVSLPRLGLRFVYRLTRIVMLQLLARLKSQAVFCIRTAKIAHQTVHRVCIPCFCLFAQVAYLSSTL